MFVPEFVDHGYVDHQKLTGTKEAEPTASSSDFQSTTLRHRLNLNHLQQLQPL